MDDSLRLLPVVETLDLSRNKFTKVDNLLRCSKLKHLDLGFNQLRTISSFSKIVKVVLRNNALSTMRGVENLKSLEGLDLSYNIISSFSELELLSGLPSLKALWLEGNPVCSANWYRPQVYSFFTDPEKLILDDKKISTREVWKRQIIIASRQKQPASFGFYSPPKDGAEIEGNVNNKMLMPLLETLYDASRRTSNQIYMVLIILLILSQDASFNASIHKLRRIAAEKEKRLHQGIQKNREESNNFVNQRTWVLTLRVMAIHELSSNEDVGRRTRCRNQMVEDVLGLARKREGSRWLREEKVREADSFEDDDKGRRWCKGRWHQLLQFIFRNHN
ncbi:hypothetical protein L2E82_02129 [Cichorium intybus]|uniref:Uncharacterized protein n=1 Tax=Cichorium intybus TaxID=13427 RepID=A0ACB9H1F6_CICIN|nr:hypothetical protein L2E82_02129 [Cichorium intybus]